MADRILIQCPSCSAKLAISDESKLGKKIRCSKCSEVFVAKAIKSGDSKTSTPAKAAKPKAKKSDDDEFNFDDMEMEDKSELEEEESEEESRPVKAKAGTTKKGAKSKGKKKSGGGNLPLIIGGSVAALLVIGAGAYFVFGDKGDAPQQAASSPPVDQQLPAVAQAEPTIPGQSVPVQPVPAQSAQVAPTVSGSPPPANAVASAQGNVDVEVVKRQRREKEAFEHGETQEVAAANLSELPAGTKKLSVKTRWGDRARDKSAPTEVNTVNLVLDLQADFLPKACAFGHANATTIQVTSDRSLRQHQSMLKLINPIVYYVPYEFQASEWTDWRFAKAVGFWSDHPPGTLRIAIPIVVPDEPISELSLIEGQFKIKIGNMVEEIAIPDVRAVANQPLEHASLKAAGATLTLKSEQHPVGMHEVLRFSIGPNYAVGPLFVHSTSFAINGTFVATSLEPAIEIGFSDRNFSTVRTMKLPDADVSPTPAGKLTMTVHLYSQIEEIIVPFRFENVPLPSADKKPKK